MKVALIITGLEAGGAEMMLKKVVERLSPRFSPHVISLTTFGDIGADLQAAGIPVETIGMRFGPSMPLDWMRLVNRLRRLKPDVVHTWMYHADFLGGVAARFAGIRAVGWGIRNSDLPTDGSKFMTRMMMHGSALVSGFVPRLISCCSEAARQIHVEAGYDAGRVRVIPNGFDISRFRPDPNARQDIRESLGIGPDVPFVGLIGRYHLQKNHLGFIDAARALRARLPNVRFALAGRGVSNDNAELRAAVDRAGLGDAIHLLGLRSDVHRLMAALDVLASSSSFGEAFPNVIGEAMACGVPCAATDVGDSSHIIGDIGRVVGVGDMAALANAMYVLLSAPKALRAMQSRAARERIVRTFEIGQVVARFEAFYEELVRGDPTVRRGRSFDDKAIGPDGVVATRENH